MSKGKSQMNKKEKKKAIFLVVWMMIFSILVIQTVYTHDVDPKMLTTPDGRLYMAEEENLGIEIIKDTVYSLFLSAACCVGLFAGIAWREKKISQKGKQLKNH